MYLTLAKNLVRNLLNFVWSHFLTVETQHYSYLLKSKQNSNFCLWLCFLPKIFSVHNHLGDIEVQNKNKILKIWVQEVKNWFLTPSSTCTIIIFWPEKMKRFILNKTKTVYQKNKYKVKIKELISKAAIKYFMTVKETHSKLNDVSYSELKVQPYLVSNMLNNEKRKSFI